MAGGNADAEPVRAAISVSKHRTRVVQKLEDFLKALTSSKARAEIAPSDMDALRSR